MHLFKMLNAKIIAEYIQGIDEDKRSTSLWKTTTLKTRW